MAEVLAHSRHSRGPPRCTATGRAATSWPAPRHPRSTSPSARLDDRPGELVEHARPQGALPDCTGAPRSSRPTTRRCSCHTAQQERAHPATLDKNNRASRTAWGSATTRGRAHRVPRGPAEDHRNRNKWVLYDGAGLKHGSAAVQAARGTRSSSTRPSRRHRPPQRRPPQHRPPRADAAPMTGRRRTTLRVAPVALDDDGPPGRTWPSWSGARPWPSPTAAASWKSSTAGVSYVQACRRLPSSSSCCARGGTSTVRVQDGDRKHAARRRVAHGGRLGRRPRLAARDVAFLEGGTTRRPGVSHGHAPAARVTTHGAGSTDRMREPRGEGRSVCRR